MDNQREKVYEQIVNEIQKKYKDYKISITLDVDISDESIKHFQYIFSAFCCCFLLE